MSRTPKKKPAAGPAHLDFELPILELEEKIRELEEYSHTSEVDLGGQLTALRQRAQELKGEIFSNLTPWQRIQLARHPERPTFAEFVHQMADDWLELHGDRCFADDRAIACGFATIGGRRLLLIGHRKGRETKDRLSCNFGSAHPEGYRKALRKMHLAAKFGLPVVTLINTPGAYPGIGAEERGQAYAIAENLLEMARLPVPVVCVVVGEGGSGGALGIGVGDRVLMLEHAYYSVISPEGCAAILWKTGEKAPEAARILRLTATDLEGFGVVDEVVPEPAGGAHRNHIEATRSLKDALLKHLEELEQLPTDQLLQQRYEKLRQVGAWIEVKERPPVPEADFRPLRDRNRSARIALSESLTGDER